jgi:hypothetical protein
MNMCWGIPDVPVEVEMPNPKIKFLDALARLCQDYDIAHIGIDGDNIIFSDVEGLNSISFMDYLNGKFVGVCQNKFMREYGGANDVD